VLLPGELIERARAHADGEGGDPGEVLAAGIGEEVHGGMIARLTGADRMAIMPIHDWTRVKPGIFHHFHHEWISAIANALNSGILPSAYYALAEQITGTMGPDVLTLKGPGGRAWKAPVQIRDNAGWPSRRVRPRRSFTTERRWTSTPRGRSRWWCTAAAIMT
jgi:hypothetical protein